MFSMQGRVALVTGAGPNIGREIALTLARTGAAIAVNDIDPARAEATAAEVHAAGVAAVALPADVSDPRAVTGMVQAAERALGPIDSLINNAAITIRKGILDSTYEEWRRIRAPVKVHTGARQRSFGKRRAPWPTIRPTSCGRWPCRRRWSIGR